ncbi:MAG: twin-arginine translocase TatA/TatE family subunit [Bdellovibrionales bacterium]|nr:twin-arginine translocase TatA/TatE family subunit [Bdellovibrionales bacterium]
MFNLGFTEIIVIGVLALVLIGPKQLPEVAKALGRLVSEFKRATEDLSGGLLDVRKDLKRPMQDVMNQVKDAMREPTQDVKDSISDPIEDLKQSVRKNRNGTKISDEVIRIKQDLEASIDNSGTTPKDESSDEKTRDS